MKKKKIIITFGVHSTCRILFIILEYYQELRAPHKHFIVLPGLLLQFD